MVQAEFRGVDWPPPRAWLPSARRRQSVLLSARLALLDGRDGPSLGRLGPLNNFPIIYHSIVTRPVAS